MNNDFSELIEYLDEKFEETAKKDEINQKFDKLFDIFVDKNDFREAILNLVTKEDFINLQTSIDTYAKKADTYFQEMLMLAHKVDRHEKWLLQIAEKIGVKLEY